MIRRFAVLGVALFVAGAAHAQAPTAQQIADRLNVSEGTAAVVADVLAGVEHEPGALWNAAATLQQRLTAEQKEELLAARSTARARGDRAQRLHSPRQAAPGMALLGRIAGHLDLTAEQREQLTEIRQRHAPAMRELAQQARSGDIERSQMRERSRELQNQLMGDVQAILTPEQQARAQEMMQGARQRGERMRAGDRQARLSAEPVPTTEQRRAAAAERMAARDAALGLTDEQRARLEQMRQERRGAVEDARRAQRSAEHRRGAAAQRGMREVLTPQQQEIMRLHGVLARVTMMRAHR